MIFFWIVLIGSVVILLLAAILSKKMGIEKSIVIYLAKQKVFGYIQYLKNQENYNVWVRMDPKIKKAYSGVDGTIGFLYMWESEKKMVGMGEQLITKIDEGEGIEFGLRFIKPRPGVATSKITLYSLSPDQTKVTWGFYSIMKYPANITRGLIQNMLGKDLQKGLENLKLILEK